MPLFTCLGGSFFNHMHGNGVEFYRRIQGFHFLESYAQLSCIVGRHVAFRINLDGINGLVLIHTHQTEGTGWGNDPPGAVITVEGIEDALLTVIVEKAVLVVVYGNLSDMGGLDLDTPGIIVGIGPVNTVKPLPYFHFHIHRIGGSRVGHVYDF